MAQSRSQTKMLPAVFEKDGLDGLTLIALNQLLKGVSVERRRSLRLHTFRFAALFMDHVPLRSVLAIFNPFEQMAFWILIAHLFASRANGASLVGGTTSPQEWQLIWPEQNNPLN